MTHEPLSQPEKSPGDMHWVNEALLIEHLKAEVVRLRAELEQTSVWQLIETAPTDGTNVLLCWHEGIAAPIFAVGRNLGTGRRWQDTHQCLHNNHSWPTHWRPLPTPPPTCCL